MTYEEWLAQMPDSLKNYSSPVYPFSFLIFNFSFCGKEASENVHKSQCRCYRRR
jgi:hypothetical protein